MSKRKPWYASKTLWFNTVLAAAAALEASTRMLQPHLPFNFYFALTVLMPAVNVALRFVSSTELTK